MSRNLFRVMGREAASRQQVVGLDQRGGWFLFQLLTASGRGGVSYLPLQIIQSARFPPVFFLTSPSHQEEPNPFAVTKQLSHSQTHNSN